MTVRSRAVSRAGSVTFVMHRGSGDLVIKLARSVPAAASLRRAVTIQRTLRADPRLDGWHRLIPPVVAAGEASGWTYLAERAMDGRSLADGRVGGTGIAADAAIAFEAIGVLHAATAQVVDRARIRREWVDARLAILESVAAGTGRGVARGERGSSAHAAAIDAVRIDVVEGLRHVRAAGWIHGDLWTANVLMDGQTVTGFVDWDSAAECELPEQDILHFVLVARRARRGGSLGATLAAVLRDGWDATDQAMLGSARTTSGLPLRAGLLLYWLRLIEVNLVRQPWLATDRAWVHANVLRVLR